MDAIVDKVFKELPFGRVGSWPSVAKEVMRYIASAPVGNHLEIGVLHGGTLAIAALARKARGIKEETIGLDPLQGYYPPYQMLPEGHKPPNTSWEDTEISLKTVAKNLAHFKLTNDVKLVQAFSYPWPEELKYIEFASVYIDGDHYSMMPLIDWVNVSRQVIPGGYVFFDDCNNNCPAVQKACKVAEKTPGWVKVDHIQNHVFVMQRMQ